MNVVIFARSKLCGGKHPTRIGTQEFEVAHSAFFISNALNVLETSTERFATQFVLSRATTPFICIFAYVIVFYSNKKLFVRNTYCFYAYTYLRLVSVICFFKFISMLDLSMILF